MSWREKTWNVIIGCSKVSEGCRHCYAISTCKWKGGLERSKHAVGENPYFNILTDDHRGFNGKLHLFEDRLDQPLQKKEKKPAIWFVNSLSDLFHDEVTLDTLKRVFETMNCADQHIFRILTKRPIRMLKVARELTWTPNIEMGVTFEGLLPSMSDKQRADIVWRVDALRQHLAKTKFISFEPLIGEIPQDLDLTDISWCFYGGESQVAARPMELQWLRQGLQLCEAYRVVPYVKQLGRAWAKSSGCMGRLQCKGEDPSVWPDDLSPYHIESLRQVTPERLVQDKERTSSFAMEQEPTQESMPVVA